MSTGCAEGIAVLGAGSWGTALAVQLARNGHRTGLWGRDAAALARLAREGANERYLPGVAFPPSLSVIAGLEESVRTHRDLLICVPSQGLRDTLEAIRPHLRPDTRVAWATKGFDPRTGQLPHAVATEVLGDRVPLAVLSGPTFAREVGAGLPTAMTVAASEPRFADDLAACLSGQQFRAYTSGDMIGVEVGGAVKNVLAIGAGISDGLRFGANTRVALITRGLVEMTRLGVALGGQAPTFVGLSGMGDLILTSTDDQSRNRRLGLMLAQGASVEAAQAAIGQVVEGVHAARAVRRVAGRLGLEMPICEQVHRIVVEGASPQDAVLALMARSLKPESDPDLWGG